MQHKIDSIESYGEVYLPEATATRVANEICLSEAILITIAHFNGWISTMLGSRAALILLAHWRLLRCALCAAPPVSSVLPGPTQAWRI